MLAVLIQAHPARAEMAEGLLECLDDRARIVYDPDPDARRRSPWRTYRLCLETALAAGASSALVLQEDALVCGGFLDAVDGAVAARPENPVAFFVPGKTPAYTNAIYRARAAGEAWATLQLGTWLPVVATSWPANLAADLLAWYDRAELPPIWSADDEIVGRFLATVGVPMLATVPSLVEHPDTVPSVMNGFRRVGDGRDPGRRAYFYIGDEPSYGCDARSIDWTAAASP